MIRISSTRWFHAAAMIALLLLLALPASARDVQRGKQLARTQFETAERMREALNGKPSAERTRREYQQVVDAYRRVYYLSPGSSKADTSAVAVAELLAEVGRSFNDEKALHAGIAQYEFLRREYPGSKHRFEALFTIGQIYKQDLDEPAKAKETFEEFLKRYPRHLLAGDARAAITEIDADDARKGRGGQTREAKLVERKSALPMVSGIRFWSTPTYTRVAIDLDAEVKYEAGRVPNPDRIFFDLHGTRLASILAGKSFDVQDGFLRKIRLAQFQKEMTRVVLEVDDVSDYSVFLLPNPYRLIIDIHGRKPQKSTQVAKADASPSGPAPDRSANATEPPSDQPEPSAAANASPSASKKAELATATTGNAASGPAHNPASQAADGKAAPVAEGSSTKAEVASLDNGDEQKATRRPTTKPTFQSVAPPAEKKRAKDTLSSNSRTAQPTADGERSLIRALGLKIGRIVVDAGHGGHDTGTIGPNGLLEKDLVLDVALRLGRLLQTRMGADVVFTRDDDTFVPLETRTAIANQEQADLFISIHANSSRDHAARGIETYYLNFTSSTDALEVAARENAVSEKSIHELQDLVKKIALRDKIEESREFAANVQQSMAQNLAAKDHGLRDRGVKKAPFVVLIGANMPSILAEISFVSNPADARKLQTPEYRQKIAEALYKGITRYVSGLSGVKVAARARNEAGQ